MIHPIASILLRRGRPRLAQALAAMSLSILLVSLLTSRLHASPPVVATAPAPPTAVPVLILRPQVTHLTAAMGHGGVLRGALEPTLPGLNTVRIALRLPPGATTTRQVTLAATMPGMAMPPVRATLRVRGSGYSGVLALPMFGLYHVEVTVETAGSAVTGMITLTLPLDQ